jgi:hypothetical protein
MVKEIYELYGIDAQGRYSSCLAHLFALFRVADL